VTASDAVTGSVDDRSEPERQRDEYLDALQRLQADFEKLPKARGRALRWTPPDRAAGEVVVKMLPVLGRLDLARAALLECPVRRGRGLGSGEGTTTSTHSRRRDWSESTPWVSSSTRKYTTRSAHVEGDDGPLVDQVLSRRVPLEGSVLRPAMVKVSRLNSMVEREWFDKDYYRS